MTTAGVGVVRRGGPTSDDAAVAALRADGLAPRPWGNPPGDTYAEHQHGYHKVLYCVAGSITFHTPSGDLAMGAGDRLDLPPGTPHSATVGPGGVRCVEASRPA